MTIPILQAGNVTISSAVNQIISQIGVPAMQVLLAIGGFAFIISLVYFIVHFAKYLLHPTQWGRSAALSEAIYSIERPIYVVVGIFLGIYALLLIAGLASGQSINAGQYAAQLLQAMLREAVSVLTTLIKQAVSTTP
jgi:hypothetical protein